MTHGMCAHRCLACRPQAWVIRGCTHRTTAVAGTKRRPPGSLRRCGAERLAAIVARGRQPGCKGGHAIHHVLIARKRSALTVCVRVNAVALQEPAGATPSTHFIDVPIPQPDITDEGEGGQGTARSEVDRSDVDAARPSPPPTISSVEGGGGEDTAQDGEAPSDEAAVTPTAPAVPESVAGAQASPAPAPAPALVPAPALSEPLTTPEHADDAPTDPPPATSEPTTAGGDTPAGSAAVDALDVKPTPQKFDHPPTSAPLQADDSPHAKRRAAGLAMPVPLHSPLAPSRAPKHSSTGTRVAPSPDRVLSHLYKHVLPRPPETVRCCSANRVPLCCALAHCACVSSTCSQNGSALRPCWSENGRRVRRRNSVASTWCHGASGDSARV